MIYRVEWDCGIVAFKGYRHECLNFIVNSRHSNKLNLVNPVTGQAESWVHYA